MPGLTVTEKEHWKDRIGRRIDKRIEAIEAEEPNFMDRVHRQARERALTSLNLTELQAESEQFERDKESLEKRDRAVEREMMARVRGVPASDIEDRFHYGRDPEVTTAIERRQGVHEDELMAESEAGRRILKLREEKDELLDTVWLAASPSQIKTLWTKVAELLGDQQTQLQGEALAIEPVTE